MASFFGKSNLKAPDGRRRQDAQMTMSLPVHLQVRSEPSEGERMGAVIGKRMANGPTPNVFVCVAALMISR